MTSSQHKMHAEYGEVSATTADVINTAKAGGRRIVAVGTTSLRLLESAAEGGTPFALCGRHRYLHHTRFQISDCRSAHDQFPSAEIDPVHAGLRLRGR